MKARQTLRRPENWQDFESLCKKLWGEIWKCAEIQKHGRSGQKQFGVDIYGVPLGQMAYCGIQCKGKDEYSHKQFTEDELDEEIKKAKLFNPKLKKLYFATTAVKDSVIEGIVRVKNIENQLSGLFEVHLFSWEDIVDLIDENKETYDWYVNSQNFKATYSIVVTFSNELEAITAEPMFLQTITRFKRPDADENYGMTYLQNHIKQMQRLTGAAFTVRTRTKTVNKSFIPIELVIKNNGDKALEEYKLFVDVGGAILDLADSNIKNDYPILLAMKNRHTTFLSKDPFAIKFIPVNAILVGDDAVSTDTFFIKPDSAAREIILTWRLVSKEYKTQGKLIVNLNPKIEKINRAIEVDSSTETRIEYGDITDFIEEQHD